MEAPPNPPQRRWLRRILFTLFACVVFLLLGFAAITFAQAWSMTHYQPPTVRTTRFAQLDNWQKTQLLLCGPTVRRQSNTKSPRDFGFDYSVRRFPGAHGLQLEAWCLAAPPNAPTVLMFPGYGASKDTLLPAAREFVSSGIAVWMIDPHGIGGSEGSVTSVGFHEAEDVAASFREAQRLHAGRPILLYGPSMGAVAILRAVSQAWVKPDALILECPFDSFTHTIGNRFAWIGMPRFPFAPAVALWAGVQQGFNGLAHNPVDYATRVSCPTLLLQGDHDESVGLPFIREVAHHFGPNARFELIPGAGHAHLVTRAAQPWRRSVQSFLATTVTPAIGSPAVLTP